MSRTTRSKVRNARRGDGAVLTILVALLPAAHCGPSVTSTVPALDAGRNGEVVADAENAEDAAGSVDGAAPAEVSARPPGVGLMHTAEQLQHIRANRSREPWASALAQLIGEATAALEHVPQPVPDLDVPGYYDDPEAHEAMKRILTEDGFAAYSLALAYQLAALDEERDRYADHAIAILHAWASTNHRSSGPDGGLVMMYRGVHLVYAADLVANYESADASWRADFRWWVDHVMREGSLEEKDDDNNHGDWGTLGAVVTAAFLQEQDALEAEGVRLTERIDRNIDDAGELPAENLRTNSGIWYTYFALGATTVAMRVLRNTTGTDLFDPGTPTGQDIRRGLDSLFHYSVHPEDWPYELPPGLEGMVHRARYPCADELEIGSPDSWPGNLFEIMSAELGVPEWAAWVEPYRPIRGWQSWIWPTLTRP